MFETYQLTNRMWISIINKAQSNRREREREKYNSFDDDKLGHSQARIFSEQAADTAARCFRSAFVFEYVDYIPQASKFSGIF